MSRFFVSGYSSESSSSEEELLSSSEEELVSSSEEDLSTASEFDEASGDESSDSEGRPRGPSYFLKKDFMKGDDSESESDSEEGRKVVKSAKEKLLDDMREAVSSLNTAKRVSNWENALAVFERLGRLLTRGKQSVGTPKFYIGCLSSLEDYLNETAVNEKESKKKMNAASFKAFNTLRQRVKKQIKEFQTQIDLYKKQPELFDSEEPIEALSMATVGADGVLSQADENGLQGTPARSLSPIFQTLKQISESRGKKNIDKFEQIRTLEELLLNVSSEKPFEMISVLQMLLSVRFDASSNQIFMPVDHWKQNESDINKFLDLLESCKDQYQFSEFGHSTDDIDIEPEPNADGIKVIFGSIISFIERLDDEFTKSLQNTDPHSTEYVERLKDESSVYRLIVRGQLYVESVTPEAKLSPSEDGPLHRAVMKRLEHIHYKPDLLIEANETEAWKGIDPKLDSKIVSRNSKPSELVEGLCDFLSKNPNKFYARSALLSKIYYYSINDQYSKARELFISSQVYGNVNSFESHLQIMYNRALVQLGLSAFRASAIEECHQILNEIANSQRLKELLGQGFNSKYPSQATVAEKQKLLPFHMHINLELLECVFMTSSLLIEIPALAAASNSAKESRRKASLKSFKNKLEFHDRQYFTGPPESIKDHIVHASRCLQKGDWLNAYNLLASIKIWKLFSDTDKLLAMMKKELQVEGLRTYIFTFKTIYSKLSVSKLSQIFKLEESDIVDILRKMVEVGDISASFEADSYIVFTSTEPQRTRLQELAIVMNEKVGLLTEKNEKTASNGFSRKQQVQQQKEQTQEEYNKFRYANVNTNNDEFQGTA